MHRESLKLIEYFRDKYLSDMLRATVLDVGSRRIAPQVDTYRSVFRNYKYTGMDIEPGLNVDIVGYENIKGTFDVVISGQVMEHVNRPWEWLKSLVVYFTEYICIIAPHTWKEHRHPIDTYRYLPDGMRDLFEYAGIRELEVVKDKVDTMGIGTK